MCILPQKSRIVTLPSIYLAETKLEHAECFIYLGHVVPRNFSYDEDIKKETGRRYIQGNLLVRIYKLCTDMKKVSS